MGSHSIIRCDTNHDFHHRTSASLMRRLCMLFLLLHSAAALMAGGCGVGVLRPIRRHVGATITTQQAKMTHFGGDDALAGIDLPATMPAGDEFITEMNAEHKEELRQVARQRNTEDGVDWSVEELSAVELVAVDQDGITLKEILCSSQDQRCIAVDLPIPWPEGQCISKCAPPPHPFLSSPARSCSSRHVRGRRVSPTPPHHHRAHLTRLRVDRSARDAQGVHRDQQARVFRCHGQRRDTARVRRPAAGAERDDVSDEHRVRSLA